IDIIDNLLCEAQSILDRKIYTHRQSEKLAKQTVATLFFEPSTRTRLSFSLAAKRLGAEIIHFEPRVSAVAKGETLLDTVFTLQAMHCTDFIVRHSENGAAKTIAESVKPHVRVINAGDGTHAHPSQALLDALAILQHRS